QYEKCDRDPPAVPPAPVSPLHRDPPCRATRSICPHPARNGSSVHPRARARRYDRKRTPLRLRVPIASAVRLNRNDARADLRQSVSASSASLIAASPVSRSLVSASPLSRWLISSSPAWQPSEATSRPP